VARDAVKLIGVALIVGAGGAFVTILGGYGGGILFAIYFAGLGALLAIMNTRFARRYFPRAWTGRKLLLLFGLSVLASLALTAVALVVWNLTYGTPTTAPDATIM
jgi:hypothetical protein